MNTNDDEVMSLVLDAERHLREAQQKLEMAAELATRKGAFLPAARIKLFRARALDLLDSVRSSVALRRVQP